MERKLCLPCILEPSILPLSVMGVEIYQRCKYQKQHSRKTKTVRKFIYLIINILLISQSILFSIHSYYLFHGKRLTCNYIPKPKKVTAVEIFFHLSIAFCNIYLCILLYLPTRKKLCIDLSVPGYKGELKQIQVLQNLLIKTCISVYLTFFIIGEIGYIKIVYPQIKKYHDTKAAIACCTYLSIINAFHLAIILSLILPTTQLLFVLIRRFMALDRDLKKNGNIQLIIEKYTENYEFMQAANESFGYSYAFGYSGYILIICILTYILIFGQHTFVTRLIFAVMVIFLALGGVIVSFAVSRVSSAAYSSFQEIRIFATDERKLENNLKILNFMKMFNQTDLGFSFADFFVCDKEFPIKISNAIYAMFDALIQFRDLIEDSAKCHSNSQAITNRTE